ncbi:hypothetical protein P9F15_29615 [Bacillus cereus]|nr:hypothetical protein [Bacillus cereus]
MGNFFIFITMLLICFLTLISPLFFSFMTPSIAFPLAVSLTCLFAIGCKKVRGY